MQWSTSTSRKEQCGRRPPRNELSGQRSMLTAAFFLVNSRQPFSSRPTLCVSVCLKRLMQASPFFSACLFVQWGSDYWTSAVFRKLGISSIFRCSCFHVLCVVYFDQLSGAACSWKLVEMCFFTFTDIFSSFQLFFYRTWWLSGLSDMLFIVQSWHILNRPRFELRLGQVIMMDKWRKKVEKKKKCLKTAKKCFTSFGLAQHLKLVKMYNNLSLWSKF